MSWAIGTCRSCDSGIFTVALLPLQMSCRTQSIVRKEACKAAVAHPSRAFNALKDKSLQHCVVHDSSRYWAHHIMGQVSNRKPMVFDLHIFGILLVFITRKESRKNDLVSYSHIATTSAEVTKRDLRIDWKLMAPFTIMLKLRLSDWRKKNEYQ